VSKNDYNYQLLLFIAMALIVIFGLGAIGSLIMFLTAFM
jgi:hypothetical protein